MVDFRERTTNALIRLLGCSERSLPLLFACNKTRLYVFSMGPVLFAISLQCAIPVSKHGCSFRYTFILRQSYGKGG